MSAKAAPMEEARVAEAAPAAAMREPPPMMAMAAPPASVHIESAQLAQAPVEVMTAAPSAAAPPRRIFRRLASVDSAIAAPQMTTADIAAWVKAEFEKLPFGEVLFSAPQEMRVGERKKVTVSISQTTFGDLPKAAAGDSASRNVERIRNIKVGTFMSARLEGNNFSISKADEDQLIADNNPALWEWDVTPLESGTQTLKLTVAVRIKIPNDKEEKKIRVLEKPIQVRVNPIYTTQTFIQTNWQWLISTAIGSGVVGWFVNKKRKKKK